MCAAASLVWSVAAQAGVAVQSTTPAGVDVYSCNQGWTWQFLGTVTLPQWTDDVLGLTSIATLTDQQWGYQSYDNAVHVGLFVNGAERYDVNVAGADAAWATRTYDLAANPAASQGLNAALDAIDWSSHPSVQMSMFAALTAWPGWELHVRNASFAVTSSVPEPGSLALMGLGMLGLAAWRRRRSS